MTRTGIFAQGSTQFNDEAGCNFRSKNLHCACYSNCACYNSGDSSEIALSV